MRRIIDRVGILLRVVIAAVIIGGSALVLPNAAGADVVVVFTPTDDATIRESAPTTNFGSRTTIEVDASSRKDSLIRFDVSGVGASTVASAKLRLYVVDASSAGGNFVETTVTSWTESSVTWQTAPVGDGMTLGSLGAVSVGNWYELDLTGFVVGDGVVSIRGSSTSSNGADYASSEDPAFAPQLELVLQDNSGDTEAPTAPTNLTVASATASAVSLAWDASTDNVAVTAYDVYRDGNLVDTIGPMPTYQDAGVVANTNYQYYVVARDAAGNTSGPSNTVSATTGLGGPATIYDVWRDGSQFHAVSQAGSPSYSGGLKFVVESALDDLRVVGSGSILFAAGDFDLGSEHFEIVDITDVTFAGQGMGVTIIRNFTNQAADTEPFDATRSDRLIIRDLTVSAGGSDRNTSDALDFDGGDDIIIERVEVTDSRGRGIIFDGKDAVSSTGGTAERNTVRDCVITNVPRDGIQLLASNHNTIENCHITNSGTQGIRVHLSSSSATQPLKPSNDNLISGNTIENSGENGILVTGGSRNVITGNTLLNNTDDGVLINTSTSSLFCDDNVVDLNTISGNGRYGININHANCRQTVVGDNAISNNALGPINDTGTNTIYTSSDTEAPMAPTNLVASDVHATSVSLFWDASTDNVAVTAYDVYRDGNLVASTGTDPTYQDNTVDLSTLYQYYVVARDAAGNMSDPSNAVDVTTSAAPPQLTFIPSDDATIRESRPTRNYGSRATLEVDTSSRKDMLMKFELTGLGESTVASATLRLFNTDSSSYGGTFVTTSDTSWSEGAVTWSSAPSADGILLDTLGAVSRNNWYEVDLSSLVTGNGTISIRVSSISSNGADYSSKENVNGNAPEIVVVTHP